MGREFGCTKCGAKVSIHFASPGETVTCRACGAANTVPEIGHEPPIAPPPAPAPEPLSAPEPAPAMEPPGPPAVGVFSDEPLSVGLIVRESFRILGAEFPRVAALSSIAAIPLVAFQLLGAWARSGPGP